MKNFFKRNILDEMYELKGDEFADKILKEMSKQKKELGSLAIEEKLTEKIKEIVTDEEKQKEILDLLNKYELSTGDDDDFWNKMYYKLGAYDCARMSEVVKTEVKEEKKEIETKTVFFDEYSDDFYDYLNTNRVRMLKENAEYKELEVKREKVKADNPNIRAIFEDKEAVQLTEDEVKAVLDMLEIEGDINTIETIENFKLGAREMLLFLKQMRLL
ncbi:MAG: hypothetical protein HFJ30_02925 [Clostridia bacterium]|jgi:hypothetical protein|nr:hypothetical protein [Clostridia bacterium]